MKLKEIADVIKGIHLTEGDKGNKTKAYKELTMVSLEPISFVDERKLIKINPLKAVSPKLLTRSGDVVVSLYHPMIACYVEKAQEGYVVPHYMAIVRMKRSSKVDSRFVVQFINSARGRRALVKSSKAFSQSRPTSLPISLLEEVELLKEVNSLIDKF
jgi:hypothetical protein